MASISFLLGTLAYVAAMLRSREVPTAPLVLYAVGAVPVSLRAFVPEAALDLGLVTLAVGIGWISIWLFRRSSRVTALAARSFTERTAGRGEPLMGLCPPTHPQRTSTRPSK